MILIILVFLVIGGTTTLLKMFIYWPIALVKLWHWPDWLGLILILLLVSWLLDDEH